jgi:hypothetical protein
MEATYEYLGGNAGAADLTLDRWRKEGGNSYFLFALRYLCVKRAEDLADAVARAPIPTCELVHLLRPAVLSSNLETAKVLSILGNSLTPDPLAQAAACFIGGA